ncbi:MAG: hypothetical protein MUF86_06220 [Akkermansiaceae bacterium]|nr:hypothetical protein [Akkermansiaceae bacterium]
MGEPGNRETGRASSNGMTLSGSMEGSFSLKKDFLLSGLAAGPVVKTKIHRPDKPYLVK